MIQQAKRNAQRQPIEDISNGMLASKTAADVVATYSIELKTLRMQMEKIRAELSAQERQLGELIATLDEWRDGIERLVAQLVSLGIVPVWRPKPGSLKLISK